MLDERWHSLPDVGGGPIQETGAALIDGRIYVVGGMTGDFGISDKLQVYDIAQGSWSLAAPFSSPLHHAQVAAAGGKLYVLGMLRDSAFSESGRSWVYDPGTDSWTGLASMVEFGRGGGVAQAIGDKIYVVGGLRQLQSVADLSEYDTVTDTWNHALPPVPGARDHLVAAVVDDILYVIGGRVGAGLLGSVWAFDPATATWSGRSPMPTARAGMAAGVVDGNIIVVGGEGASNGSGVFAEVESYDPVSDTWTSLGVMPRPRHGMAAVGYGDTLYVPGGARRQGFSAVATFDAFVPAGP